MMRTEMLFLTLAVLVGIVGAGLASADQPTLYYQGYFEGQATPVPPVGFVYRANPNTIQPSFYYRYRAVPLPKPDCDQAAAGPSLSLGTQPLVMAAPVPLPGIYWYQDPSLFRGVPMCNLWWPYGTSR
jgi:hypothetical protein